MRWWLPVAPTWTRRGGAEQVNAPGAEPPAGEDGSPAAEVGRAMRAAREARRLSLRDLAKKLGFNSHTRFSGYELGRQLPPDEIVEGYEKVLDLEPNSLMRLVERARIAEHGDSFPKRRKPLGTQMDAVNRPRRRVLIAALVVALIAAVVAVVVILVAEKNRVRADDGSDAISTGCDADAVTLDHVDVYFPAQYKVGTLELRASPYCGTSWGKFTQAKDLPTTPPLNIKITASRPADGAMRPFALDYVGENIYGDQLISRFQCVFVEIIVTRDHRTSSAPISTSCQVNR